MRPSAAISTEEDWLTCLDRNRIFAYVRSSASDRKLRLFACACCRQVWNLLIDERSRDAVEIAERFADGKATRLKVREMRTAARRAANAIETADITALYKAGAVWDPDAAWSAVYQRKPLNLNAWNRDRRPSEDAFRSAAWAAWAAANTGCTSDVHQIAEASSLVGRHAAWGAAQTEAQHGFPKRKQAGFLRDIFGNPFRPVAIDPVWRTSAVSAVANAIYEERCFTDMPILADALEEASCTNADILAHCRSGGEHVRGCWVVDLVLHKE
jgi:hypothetical protein